MKEGDELHLKEEWKEQFASYKWGRGRFYFVKPHKTNADLVMVKTDTEGKSSSFSKDVFQEFNRLT